MAYVITQACCNDASCVSACPVNCIHPTPEEAEFATTEMLYIEPQACIDCGACVDACPVGAIFPEDQLTASLERYREINADYYTRHPLQPGWIPLTPAAPPVRDLGTLRVAIVGAGPAACYAAEELLKRSDVEVEMFEKLPTPWGLVRAGVAPDHPGTKAVTEMFDWSLGRDAFQFHLNVEVGKHVSHADLLAHHHAVIYAVGASSDRALGIPGEDLPGSHAATEFVAWYNGHPDYADRTFDLSGERAVVVGNGNVALDVARILTADPDDLAKTDIADHALEALRRSNIREVVLLGRRGPAQAAYTNPEFLALGDLPGVDVVIDPVEVELEPASQALLDSSSVEPAVVTKVRLAQEFSQRTPTPGNKRIVFRYLASPTEVLGAERVDGLTVAANELVEDASGALTARPTGRTERVDTALVLRAIGYRGRPLAGVPFDDRRGVIPNDRGRVVAGAGESLDGVYVTGWIKRGPNGVIGTNKTCAKETVARIVEDFEARRLPAPAGGRKELGKLLARRRPERISRRGWDAIDRTERARGQASGRPRVKMTDTAEMVVVGRQRRGLFAG
ncbi:4Fe-4S dicluster domain-containing protein [Prescottella agglutinans]|uniref:ferredoxin--NADP(+) reductase n=1 Tax=Prescottella agglutinans TaxID=1644129 RepID=A0A438BGR1_9NOCA|nr:FAD-dependent oxidoreductase [Prescottella agglutinans]RVW10229.1 4Fe-4S dicluster domain-containing protein [Prescottella agglutinans]